MAFLEVRDLHAGYGTPVVEGVTFAVETGRVLALIGANGAGKTTTLRAVAGLIAPSGGRVEVGGCDMTGARPEVVSRAGVLLIPEGGGIFRDLTVLDNLRLSAWRLRDGRVPIDERVQRAFDAFPVLGRRRRQQAGSLSGGERQMLAIGQALVTDARVVLIDEASLGLAPAMVDQLFSEIGGLRARGRGVLLVEQNAAAALEVADEVLVMEKGRIVFAGEPAQLRRRRDLMDLYLGEVREDV